MGSLLYRRRSFIGSQGTHNFESMSWFTFSGTGSAAPSRLQPQVPQLIESREKENVVQRARLDARSIASKPAPVAKSWAHFVAGG